MYLCKIYEFFVGKFEENNCIYWVIEEIMMLILVDIYIFLFEDVWQWVKMRMIVFKFLVIVCELVKFCEVYV